MFWGLKLESDKAYKQSSLEPFRLTSAVLDVSTAGNAPIQVGLKYKNENYIICTLNKQVALYQVTLDLQFERGDELSFFKMGGKGTVHLLGYEVQEFDETLSDEGDEEDAELDVVTNESEVAPTLTLINKRKKDFELSSAKKKSKLDNMNEENKPKGTPKSTKKEAHPQKKEVSNAKQDKPKSNKVDLSISDLLVEDFDEESSDEDFFGGGDEDENAEEEEDEDSSEDEDIDTSHLEEGGEDEEEEEDDGEQEEDEDSDDEGEEEDMETDIKAKASPSAPSKKAKKLQLSNEKSKKFLTPTTINGDAHTKKDKSRTPQSLAKSDKENYKHQDTPKPPKKTPSKETPPSQKRAKFVKKGGVSCEDLEVGSGAEAKLGSSAFVYYEGRLRKSGKLFDKKLSGEPFNFRLGKSEVIKGWDVAVEGMKVGGKRRICIPPHMAYGNKGSPPEIPPHSALVFEIELRDVKK